MAIDPVNDVRTLHINGVEVTDIASAPAFVDPVYDGDTLIFGVRSDFVPSTHFHGKMDDIKIYDRVLTSGEITQLFNDQSYVGVVPSGLVSRYTFTGNANDDIGGAHGNNNGANLSWDRFGNPTGSYFFGGSNSHISVQSPVHNFTGTTTISMWVKLFSSTEINYHLFDTREASNLSVGSPVGWIDTQSERVEFGVPGGGISQYSVDMLPEQWYHLVMIYDVVADQKLLYLNGIPITDIPSPGVYIDPLYVNAPMIIGARADIDPSSIFNGNIDDIRIYNRVLSGGEVTELYHEGGYLVVTDMPNTDRNNEEITAYPNPCTDVISFSGPNEIETINVYEMSGRLIKTISRPVGQINVSELKTGLYLVSIIQKDGSRSLSRIMKQ